jgi:hypothetical protein
LQIRLQYLQFLEDKFFADTIRDICNLGSFAISWRNQRFHTICNHHNILNNQTEKKSIDFNRQSTLSI